MWWVLAIVIAAGASFWLARSSGAGAAPARNTVKSVVHLDTFVLNLAGPEPRSYLRVGIDVGTTTDPNTNAAAGGPPVALLRDTIIGVLSKSDADALLKTDGKDKLKAELVTALRERAPDLGVQEVYFTEFLVQR